MLRGGIHPRTKHVIDNVAFVDFRTREDMSKAEATGLVAREYQYRRRTR